MTVNWTNRLGGARAQLAIKAPVLAASTGNVTLSGEQTQDGVALVAGNRFLAKDQTTAAENGIWDVKATAWTRAKDWDGSDDVTKGTRVYVAPGGTTNGNTEWVVTTSGTITPGTTSVALTLFQSHATAQTIWVPASAMTPRVTNGPAYATTELATNDVMVNTLDFDQTTEEGAGFMIAMPPSWNEGTVTFTPYWTAASGSGGVVWGLAAYAFSDDDAMDTAVSGQQTSTDTLILANDLHRGPESSAITIGGTPAEGDTVYFEITREVGNASDTLSADARLIGIHVTLTLNEITDA